MRLFLLTLSSAFIALSTFAQAPNIQWAKCYGGTGVDKGRSVKVAKDGGYIMAGSKSQDIWIIKSNDTGKLSWAYTLTGDGDDEIYSVALTNDGGYIGAGFTNSLSYDYTGLVHHYPGLSGLADALVIKLDSTGKLKWKKCFGGGGWEKASSIVPTKDGGYIFCGYTMSIVDGDVTHRTHFYGHNPTLDVWIVKLDDTGRIMWQQTIGGSGTDYANSVIQTTDGGYLVGGYTTSTDSDITENRGYWDALAIKLNDTGGIVWNKTYGGTGFETFAAVNQTTTGEYFCTGSSTSNDMDVSGNHLDSLGNPTNDVWVAKLNDTGALTWQHCYGGSDVDQGTDAHQTFDGGYVISGITQSANGDVSGIHASSFPANEDGWVLKIDNNGVIQWQKCLGGTELDEMNSIAQTSDSDYIVFGFVASTDGDVKDFHGGEDFWAVKLSNKPMPTSFIEALIGNLSFGISPNPSHNSFTLQYSVQTDVNMEIVDVAGKIVYHALLSKNAKQASINASVWKPGIYFYKVLQNGNVLESGKLVKE